MTSTADQPGPFDALVKARPGEPIFTLLGRDAFAPALVAEWANLNRKRALGNPDLTPDKLELELRQSTEAEEIAWSMMTYQRGEDERAAEPKEERRAYTGHELPAETVERDKRQNALISAAGRINNAVAELAEIAETLRQLQHPDAEVLEKIVPLLKGTAETVQPQRIRSA